MTAPDITITALRAEVETLREMQRNVLVEQGEEVSRLRAEVEKLRAALKQARPFIGWAGHYPTILAEIDAALEGKP